MLTTATLGMACYAVYSVIAALIDLFVQSRLEVVADLGLLAFGLVLLVAAAFVRVMIPGGLLLAIGALLGLQALSIHSDVHLGGSVSLAWQIVRGIIAVALVTLAHFGAEAERK